MYTNHWRPATNNQTSTQTHQWDTWIIHQILTCVFALVFRCMCVWMCKYFTMYVSERVWMRERACVMCVCVCVCVCVHHVVYPIYALWGPCSLEKQLISGSCSIDKYPSSRMANRYTRIFDAGGWNCFCFVALSPVAGSRRTQNGDPSFCTGAQCTKQ